MAFTIDDFHDLLRLLEEYPEWRAELRRHVLSDELLELPALVRQLAEAQARTEARVEALAEGLATLTARVEALAEAQTQTTLQLQALGESQFRMEARLGTVEGDVLEARYARRAGAYFGPLARRIHVVDHGRLADRLDDAIDAGQLTEEDRRRILAADVVLRGVRRRDQAEVYLVVEVSAGIGPHDVERAVERAQLLEKLGTLAIPVVAGNRIDPHSESLARAQGVWQVLDGPAIPPSQPASA